MPMALDYLFPCTHCGQQFSVAANSAGMNIDCPFCEQSNVLPGLRQIKRFPTKDQSATSRAAQTASTNEARSMLFSVGLLTGVVAAIFAIGVTWRANTLATASRVDEQIEYSLNQLERLSAGQLWDQWNLMTRNGLPDWQESPAVSDNKQSRYLYLIAYALYGISALGFLALLYSLVKHRR